MSQEISVNNTFTRGINKAGHGMDPDQTSRLGI
jgi:hypothetical protein